jgi:hypothetical protein
MSIRIGRGEQGSRGAARPYKRAGFAAGGELRSHSRGSSSWEAPTDPRTGHCAELQMLCDCHGGDARKGRPQQHGGQAQAQARRHAGGGGAPPRASAVGDDI